MIEQSIQEELKQKLLDEKKQLEKELGLIAEKEEDDYKTKFENLGRNEDDNAEELEEYSNKVGVTETLEKKLKEVNEALGRIENGTYGICTNCLNEEIPVERLRAYPSAKTCLKCQK